MVYSINLLGNLSMNITMTIYMYMYTYRYVVMVITYRYVVMVITYRYVVMVITYMYVVKLHIQYVMISTIRSRGDLLLVLSVGQKSTSALHHQPCILCVAIGQKSITSSLMYT